MTNKPFVSHNTNIYNESSFSKAPATLGENPVIIEQLSNRQIIDKNSTSIHKNVTIPLCNPAPQAQPRIDILQGEKNMFPGGISYTFNPLAQNCAFQYNTKPLCTTSPYKHFRTNNQPRSEINCNVNSYQQPSLTLEQQIALKQLEKEGLELVLFAERLKRNPYSLKFHQTQQTSTTDLSNGPKGTPDFNNVCGEMSSLKKDIQTISTHEVQTSDPACLYPSKKKLVLKKSPDLKKQEPSIGKDNDEASDESENKNSKTSKKRKRSSKKCKKHNKRRKCSSSKSRNARKLNSDQIKKRNTNRKCSINCKCSDKESSDSDSESDSDFSEDSLSN